MATTPHPDTLEALQGMVVLLDGIDHSARAGASDVVRLELVGLARQVARRADALSRVLVAEADAAGSSVRLRGTPTTSWLDTDPVTGRGEAAGLLFSGREIAGDSTLQQASLHGAVSVSQARLVSKAFGQLPEGLDDAQQKAVKQDLVAHAGELRPARIPQVVRDSLLRVAPEAAPSVEDEQQRLEVQRRHALARRHLRLSHDGNGSVDIRGSLPALEAEPLRVVLNSLVESERHGQRRAGDRRDPRHEITPDQRRADALVSLVRCAQLGTGGTGRTPAPGVPAAVESGAVVPVGVESGTGVPAGVESGTGVPAGVEPGTVVPAAVEAAARRDSAGVFGVGGNENQSGLFDGHGSRSAGSELSSRTGRGRGGGRTLEGLDPHGPDAGTGIPRGSIQRGSVEGQGLGDGQLPPMAGVRPRVVVTMSEESLRARAEQAGVLGEGVQIGAGDLRRLCCDAEIVPVVLGGRSQPLDVGRAHRLVTPAIRQALWLRDGGCVFPGCAVADHRCEAHHLRPWWDGGVTALNNLVLVCPHHHGVVEPARFFSGDRPDRWEVRLDAEGCVEVIPPARMDPVRRPISHVNRNRPTHPMPQTPGAVAGQSGTPDLPVGAGNACQQGKCEPTRGGPPVPSAGATADIPPQARLGPRVSHDPAA